MHDAWMDDATHQTSMKSPLKLSICPTMALRPVYRTRLTLNPLTWKIWWAPSNASRWQMGFNSAFKGLDRCNVASQEVTACLAWAPGGDRLPPRCFVRAPEKLPALGPILQDCKPDWLRRYGWDNADLSMYSIDLAPSDYAFLDLWRSTWLTSDL
jgi:hypothetical protein